jgi:hypothetical protein
MLDPNRLCSTENMASQGNKSLPPIPYGNFGALIISVFVIILGKFWAGSEHVLDNF